MDKQLLRYFVTTRPALQELLKEALNTEKKFSISHCKHEPNGKDQQRNEETSLTNGQSKQPVTKWQDQIHT